MALAGLGSVITMTVVFLVHVALNKNVWKEMKESFRIEKGDRPLGEEALADLLKKR